MDEPAGAAHGPSTEPPKPDPSPTPSGEPSTDSYPLGHPLRERRKAGRIQEMSLLEVVTEPGYTHGHDERVRAKLRQRRGYTALYEYWQQGLISNRKLKQSLHAAQAWRVYGGERDVPLQE